MFYERYQNIFDLGRHTFNGKRMKVLVNQSKVELFDLGDIVILDKKIFNEMLHEIQDYKNDLLTINNIIQEKM